MEIQNNIIKCHLRNVLFICGTACGGKTTMSKLLAEKHHLYRYDMDEMYDRHRAIADERHQPDTCYHMKDFHEQWMRPVEEQARWNINSIKEQTEMVLLDLMEVSQNQKVVADVLYSPVYTQKIIDYNHIIFLTVDKKEIRNCYFNRPEKQDFYEFVKRKALAAIYFENIFQGLELTNEWEHQMMKESGFLVYERNRKDTKAELLKMMEKHFKL